MVGNSEPFASNVFVLDVKVFRTDGKCGRKYAAETAGFAYVQLGGDWPPSEVRRWPWATVKERERVLRVKEKMDSLKGSPGPQSV
eukprot:3501700-Amphidinium_carterae.1